MGISRRKLRGGWMRHLGGDHVFHKGLWALERDSVARACLVGLLVATSPFLGLHIVLAVLLCIIFRANVPVAFAIQWVTNIFTAPIFYPMAYWLGCEILRKPLGNLGAIHDVCDNLWDHLLMRPGTARLGPSSTVLLDIVLPLLFGCTVVGLISGLLAYLSVIVFWAGEKAEPV